MTGRKLGSLSRPSERRHEKPRYALACEQSAVFLGLHAALGRQRRIQPALHPPLEIPERLPMPHDVYPIHLTSQSEMAVNFRDRQTRS